MVPVDQDHLGEGFFRNGMQVWSDYAFFGDGAPTPACGERRSDDRTLIAVD